MDNSMEQRFVDRLLHALAAMGDYSSAAKAVEPVPAAAQDQAPTKSPFSH
jgi:hypothetical protein